MSRSQVALLSCFIAIGFFISDVYCTDSEDESDTSQVQDTQQKSSSQKRRKKSTKTASTEKSGEVTDDHAATQTVKSILEDLDDTDKQEIVEKIERVTKENVDSDRKEYAVLLVDLYEKAGDEGFTNFIKECVKVKNVRRELNNIIPSIKGIGTDSSKDALKIINRCLSSKSKKSNAAK